MSLEVPLQPLDTDSRHGLGPLHSNEIIIGLALGSPRENPLPSVPQEYLEDYPLPSALHHERQERDEWDNVSQLSQSSPPRQPVRAYPSQSGLKRSGSKWKNLGSLFTKKAPSAPAFGGQPFYMLDRPKEGDWAHTAHEPSLPKQLSAQHPKDGTTTALEPAGQIGSSAEPSHEGGAKAFLRRASTRRKAVRKRARAQTTGSLENNRSPPARVRLEDRKGPERPGDASMWLKLEDSGNQKTSTGTNPLSGESPLLQIDIPSVELERYSVMFGDLLPPNSAKSPPLRLSRAQSQLREHRPAATGKENKPIGPTLLPLSSNPPLSPNPPRPPHSRRDSSSSTGSKSSSKSANYGLFPSTGLPKKRNPAHKPLSKPSPLSRSVTAPNTTAKSLLRPILQTSKSQGPDELLIKVPGTEVPSLPKVEAIKKDRHHHRRSSSLNPSDFSAGLFPSTFEYDDYSYEDDYPRPSSANEARKEIPARHAFPVRKSSMKAPRAPPATPPTLSPQLCSKPPSNCEPLLPQPGNSEGEVSIARQISISRRQRNLVPIVPQVARQPLQVNLVNSSNAPALRKSHHLTFEDIVDRC